MFWKRIRGLFFRLDAEFAHHLTCLFIRFGIRLWNVPLRIVSGGVSEAVFASQSKQQSNQIQVLGLTFTSRIGLAAGFDKNAEMLMGFPALGFGFVEIGTVTPRPQPGNPRPRLFRDSHQGALFNRMGFNGLGATIISERLARVRERLPENFRVGVNLGKNKDTSNENAADDYVRVARAFEGMSDYLVVNVSSPNTPGLRSLQTVEALKPILYGVRDLIMGWKRVPPLLLKLAPELESLELTHLIQTIETWECGTSNVIDGWVLTNTLEGSMKGELKGGWSGRPLAEASRRSLVEARKVTRKPIISVGGIMSSGEALSRISLGADLIQIYTGWIYGGPRFPRELRDRIRI